MKYEDKGFEDLALNILDEIDNFHYKEIEFDNIKDEELIIDGDIYEFYEVKSEIERYIGTGKEDDNRTHRLELNDLGKYVYTIDDKEFFVSENENELIAIIEVLVSFHMNVFGDYFPLKTITL